MTRNHSITAAMGGLAIVALISWRFIRRDIASGSASPAVQTMEAKRAGPAPVSTVSPQPRPLPIKGAEAPDGQVLSNERPPVRFLNLNGELSREFIEHFGIAEGEARGVQAAIAKALAELRALSLAQATATRPSPTTVEITVTALEGGGQIYDAFVDSFYRILGQSRAAIIVHSYSGEIDLAFLSFGAVHRRFSIERRADSSYLVSEEFRTIAIEGGGEVERCENGEKLRQRLGGLATLLPPDF